MPNILPVVAVLIDLLCLFSVAQAKVTYREAARSLECEDAALGIAVKEHSVNFGKGGNPQNVKFGYDIKNSRTSHSSSLWYVDFPDEDLVYSFYVYDSGCRLVQGTIRKNK